MTTYNNSLTGISSGTAITTGNSGGTSGTAFNAVAGSVTVNTSADLTAAYDRGFIAALSTSSASYVAWTTTTQTEGYIRFYFRVAGTPPATVRLARGYSGSTIRWEVRLTTGLVVMMTKEDGNTVAQTASAISTNTIYRVEVGLTGSGADLHVYAGEGTSELSNTDFDTAYVSGTWSQVRFGAMTSANQTYSVDLAGLGWRDTGGLLGAIPAGTDYTRPLSEAVGVADAQTMVRTMALSDATGVTDAQAAARTMALGEAVGATDARSRGFGLFPTGATGVTDTRSLGRALALSEAVGTDEGGTPELRYPRNLGDATGVTDSAAVNVGWRLGLTEAVGNTDAVGRGYGYALSGAVGATDARTAARSLSLSDAVGATELYGQGKSIAQGDAAGVTDQAVTKQGRRLAVGDPAGVTDARTLAGTVANVVLHLTEAVGLTNTGSVAPAQAVSAGTVGVTNTGVPTWELAVSAGTLGMVDRLGAQGVPWQVSLTDRVGLTNTGIPTHTKSYSAGTIHLTDPNEERDVSETVPEPVGVADLVPQSRLLVITDRAGVVETFTETKVQPTNYRLNLAEAVGATQGYNILQTLRVAYGRVGVADTRGVYPNGPGEVYSVSLSEAVGVVNVGEVGLTQFATEGTVRVLDPGELSELSLDLYEDVAVQVEDPGPVLHHPYWLFLPPTVEEAPIGDGIPFEYFEMERGVTVLLTDGVTQEVRFPSAEQEAAADQVFRGGYEHQVDSATAALLEANGYTVAYSER